MWYNSSGPTGCVTTLPALTTTFLFERIDMADDSLPETRAAAKAMGAKYYQTDEPCNNGHLAPRYACTGKCKACVENSTRQYYAGNKDRINAESAAWAKRNPERRLEIVAACRDRIKADPVRTEQYRQKLRECKAARAEQSRQYNAEWYRRNAEYASERFKAYYRANTERYAAHSRRRQARQIQRTPSWLTEADHEAILALYAEAARLTRETGVKHEVDHIVPLQGDFVSGLHVPWNLQILTCTANRSKGNRHGD